MRINSGELCGALQLVVLPSRYLCKKQEVTLQGVMCSKVLKSPGAAEENILRRQMDLNNGPRGCFKLTWLENRTRSHGLSHV